MVVVLDETLLECADATAGIQDSGWVIVNSPRLPEELGLSGSFSVATADATAAAEEARLFVAGTVMVNTAMLGAVARVTELVTLDAIAETLAEKYKPKVAQKNLDAARLTF